MTDHFDRSRSPFRERVQALAGHPTFREPAAGSTEQRTVPTDHMIAAALSFGRRDRDDIGPDIAIDMATGRRQHALRVCEALGRALASDRSALVKRMRPFIAIVAADAYGLLVDGRRYPVPDGAIREDWDTLVSAACLILERLADDSLALAARRWRQEAA